MTTPTKRGGLSLLDWLARLSPAAQAQPYEWLLARFNCNYWPETVEYEVRHPETRKI